MNLLGEPLHVGHHVHAGRREVEASTIDFYAETLGDRHEYFRPDAESPFGGPIAPPLLFHSEVYRHPERWYLKKLVGNLHARQEWLLFAPLRPGSSVHTRSTLVDRYTRRGRDYLVNEVDFTDTEGRLLVRSRTHQSFLLDAPPAAEGFVVDRRTASAKGSRGVGEGEGPEIEPAEVVVDRTRCWRFSGPGRNYHTDAEEARKLGFPEIVVQGMFSTCLVSRIMGRAFGDGWFAGGRMDLKLVNVLWAGERVRARGRLAEESQEGPRRRRQLDVWVEKCDEAATPVVVGTASALV